MSDNYQPLWTLVDGYREMAKALVRMARGRPDPEWKNYSDMATHHARLADTLERAIREETGDLPVKEDKPDLVSAYSEVIEALKGGAMVARDMVDLQGHTVRKIDAARAQVIANRCDRALKTLKRAGELI